MCIRFRKKVLDHFVIITVYVCRLFIISPSELLEDICLAYLSGAKQDKWFAVASLPPFYEVFHYLSFHYITDFAICLQKYVIITILQNIIAFLWGTFMHNTTFLWGTFVHNTTFLRGTLCTIHILNRIKSAKKQADNVVLLFCLSHRFHGFHRFCLYVPVLTIASSKLTISPLPLERGRGWGFSPWRGAGLSLINLWRCRRS